MFRWGLCDTYLQGYPPCFASGEESAGKCQNRAVLMRPTWCTAIFSYLDLNHDNQSSSQDYSFSF